MGCMRNPKTTAERRASQSRGSHIQIDGYLVKIRARRNAANLVDSWDDIMVGWGNNRTWKKYRKNQWKLKSR